jgi:predicted peptidase
MAVLARQPGIHEQVFTRRDRRYTIAIPAGYAEQQAAPLVLALHYAGPVTPFYGKGILVGLVEPALRELGAVIVAPDCQHETWANPSSELEIVELLAYLQDNYALDAHRTLVTGYSLGGAGAWYLAARNQSRFAAAIPMAGWPPPDSANLRSANLHSANVRWEIPLYVIHSRQDEVVPFEPTEQFARRLQAGGAAIECMWLQDATHYETGYYIEPLRATLPWIRKVWKAV